MSNAQAVRTIDYQNDTGTEAFLFPHGMAGFPEDTRYGFLYEGRGDIVCMQSLDNIAASFLMTPWDEVRLGPPPALTSEQRFCLQMEYGEMPFWMLVLNPFANPEWIVANLRAPVAVNDAGRRGVQCIQADPNLELRYRWMPQPDKAP
ncbi:MAG TPA: flagellar assembly protein FliW [Mariprofundaceae bacterium]|nr:flagellar assembly protein FliW [Mariprofundaceae bacterium]